MIPPIPRERRAARFVVLAAPRTGSNWLCTLLDSHPDILCHHELFNPKGIHYAVRLRDGAFSLGTKEERESDPLSLLERAWATNLGHAVVGFKLNWSQNEKVFKAVLGDTSVKKLMTVRRNRVKTFVSELVAQTTGQWESYIGRSPRGEAARVRVDVDTLREQIRRNNEYYAWLHEELRQAGQEHIEIVYEDLESDDERRRILEFLGVTPDVQLLKAGTFKRNPPDLREVVENYEELASALRGTDLFAELESTAS